MEKIAIDIDGVVNSWAEIVRKLIERNLTIATMESCTGGGIANAITSISGASEVLKESYGSYVDIYKTEIPKAINTAKSSSTGKSIFEYDKNSPVAKAYENFAKEVLFNDRTKAKNEVAYTR